MNTTTQEYISAEIGLAGIIVTARQACLNIVSMTNPPSWRNVMLETMSHNIIIAQESLSHLQEALEKAEDGVSPQVERSALLNVNTLRAILTECILVISDLGSKVYNIMDLSRGSGLEPNELVTRYIGAIRDNIRKLATCKTAITKLVTLFNVEQEYEALRCRARVDEAAGEMIEDNFWLGRRIAEMIVLQENNAEATESASSSELTLKDVGKLSLISLPLEASEIRFGGEFFAQQATDDGN